jgi:hypothetical protein
MKVPTRLSPVVLLTLAVLAASGAQAQAGEDPAATILVPDGGRIVQQGDRLDIYDAKSKRTGYGYTRSDGSVDVFNMDGSRKATITPGPAGGPARVTTPKGKR